MRLYARNRVLKAEAFPDCRAVQELRAARKRVEKKPIRRVNAFAAGWPGASTKSLKPDAQRRFLFFGDI
jgi:hypothetical protein